MCLKKCVGKVSNTHVNAFDEKLSEIKFLEFTNLMWLYCHLLSVSNKNIKTDLN